MTIRGMFGSEIGMHDKVLVGEPIILSDNEGIEYGRYGRVLEVNDEDDVFCIFKNKEGADYVHAHSKNLVVIEHYGKPTPAVQLALAVSNGAEQIKKAADQLKEIDMSEMSKRLSKFMEHAEKVRNETKDDRDEKE